MDPHPKATAPNNVRRPNPFISETFRHKETPSFFRARWHNAFLGVGLLAFVGSVFMYTLRSVSQDDFKTYDEHGIKREQRQ
jgi:hypothetical protein